jgi:hypothetical protein
MYYAEKKTEEGYEYFNEDLYGNATIKSKNKLSPDILDQIICEMVMDRKIKKGHTKDLSFTAEFKSQWEDEKEVKVSWFKEFKNNLKNKLINLIKKL